MCQLVSLSTLNKHGEHLPILIPGIKKKTRDVVYTHETVCRCPNGLNTDEAAEPHEIPLIVLTRNCGSSVFLLIIYSLSEYATFSMIRRDYELNEINKGGKNVP